MAADASLPAEAELLALVARAHEAEAAVRALLAQAVEGDRRSLLAEALLLLAGLRRDAPLAGGALERAFLVCAAAVALVLGRPIVWPDPTEVRDLSGSLVKQLTQALLTAEAGSRRAFRDVTAETLDDRSQDAVTALIDDAGARRPLGFHIATTSLTLGRHASSRGTRWGVAPGGLVRIDSHPNPNPICLDGALLMVGRDPLPPYHVACKHHARPAGASLDDHLEAQTAAARRVGELSA